LSFLINHTGQDQHVPDLRGTDALTGAAYESGVPVPAGEVVILAHS
jgi:hypothetical protein